MRLRFLGIHSVAAGHLCMGGTLCLSFFWVGAGTSYWLRTNIRQT